MREWRLGARNHNHKKISELASKIFEANKNNNTKFCRGLPERLANLIDRLFEPGVLTEDPAVDAKHKYMSDVLQHYYTGRGREVACGPNCNGFHDILGELVSDVGYEIEGSKWECCSIYCECFQNGVFNFSSECETHEQSDT